MASYPARQKTGKYTSGVVTCKRCGKEGLAWNQNRQGKWYLCETSWPAYAHGEGYYFSPRNYHKCDCTN